MANRDWAFSDEYTFKGNDPWEYSTRRKNEMARRGRKVEMPGSGRRKLLGLEEDQMKDWEALYGKNRWEMASKDLADQAEKKRYDQRIEDEADEDAEKLRAWRRMGKPRAEDEDEIGEDFMWRAVTFEPRPRDVGGAKRHKKAS